MQVKDIMTREIITVTEDMRLRVVSWNMEQVQRI